MSADSSIEQMSEQFVKEKAHVVNDNTIELTVQDVSIYPDENQPTLLIDCGFPLEEYFIRVELDSLPQSGYDKILELYPEPFVSFDDLIDETITIKLKNVNNEHTDKSKNSYLSSKTSSPEEIDVEHPIKFNGWDVHICEVLRGYEYGIKKSHNMDIVKNNVEKAIHRYTMIHESIDSNTGLQVQSVIPSGERSFYIHVGNNKKTVIPIHVQLPSISNINNHPVSEFIDNFASGEIKNLQDEIIYLGDISNKNCIGEDIIYKKYGLYTSYPNINEDDNNKSFIKKLFNW